MRLSCILPALCLALTALPSGAQEVNLRLYPDKGPTPGQKVRLVAQLTDERGAPLKSDMLKTVDGQIVRLHIIDSGLTRLETVSARQTSTPGSYLASFIPVAEGGYHAWANITLLSNNERYLPFGMIEPADAPPQISWDAQNAPSMILGYSTGLYLHGTPVAGQKLLANISLTDEHGISVLPTHLLELYAVHQSGTALIPADITVPSSTMEFSFTPKQDGWYRLFARFIAKGKTDEARFDVLVLAPTVQ